MTRAQAADPWRVVAPLAGDRSLRGLAATKRLHPEQRSALEHRLIVREYRRHAIIYRPGETADSLYVILAGVARLSLPMSNGRRVLLHLLPTGEMFGHSALVEAGTPRVFEAAAYTDLRLGRVTASLIEAARGFGVPDARGHVLALRITQDAIAELSAGSLRKVNAVLRRFEQEGLISKQGGRIVLHQLRELEDLARDG